MVLGTLSTALCGAAGPCRVRSEERQTEEQLFSKLPPGSSASSAQPGGTGYPVAPGTIHSPSQYPLDAPLKE